MTFSFAAVVAAAQDSSSALELTATAFLFIVILAFAIIGFYRGWQRGLVTLGFYLGVLLVLVLNGGQGIATFIFDVLPKVLQVMAGNSAQANPPPDPDQVRFVELITLAVAITAGYLVSNKAFPKPPATPVERLLGILPSIVSGYALVYYVSNSLVATNNGPPATLLMIDAPNGNSVGSSLVIVFVIAVVVVVAALIAANAKKPPAKK